MSIQQTSNRIVRIKHDRESDSTHEENVSNFSIKVLSTVQVSRDAGGPGLLLKLQRYPDDIDKTMFCPMSDIASSVKQFTISVNQQFPGGSLFLLLTDTEFKKLLMSLSNEMLETTTAAKHAARIIGKNHLGNEEPVWIFSEDIQISIKGSIMTPSSSSFLWLRRVVNGSNLLIQKSLQCSIATPLDSGEALSNLCLAIRKFMPENFLPAAATIASILMGANYTATLKVFGCCGVPVGPVGACKSEASKCALSVFGAHMTHTFNGQTTPSYLFKAASKTTIPIVVDDVSERAADSWEELIIDAYNGTGRGTRMYDVESFITLPIVSANWTIGADRPRAHSRTIHIPFQQHDDEPNASLLFDELCRCRVAASKSVGLLIELSRKFEGEDTKVIINQNISPVVTTILSRYDAPARFITSHSIFMFFFQELTKLISQCCLDPGTRISEDDSWDFFADHIAPSNLLLVRGQEIHTKEVATQLVKDFLQALADVMSNTPMFRALQIIATDKDTGCHLGKCIAVRLSDAIPLVNSTQCHDDPEDTRTCRMFTVKQVDNALRSSGLGKRSKQRFLNATSKDSTLCMSRKGSGGNTTPYSCVIVDQGCIDGVILDCFRKATNMTTPYPESASQGGVTSSVPMGETDQAATPDAERNEIGANGTSAETGPVLSNDLPVPGEEEFEASSGDSQDQHLHSPAELPLLLSTPSQE